MNGENEEVISQLWNWEGMGGKAFWVFCTGVESSYRAESDHWKLGEKIRERQGRGVVRRKE